MTIAARPTTYEGIRMRSRAEAHFAAFLDRVGIDWEYEPEAFASAAGQYLPDFGLRQGPHAPVVWVDVKGPLPTRSEADHLLARMAVIWATDPGAALVMAPAACTWRTVLVALNGAGSPAWFEGFFGICGACHRAGLGLRRSSGPWMQCGSCGHKGHVAAVLDPWQEVA